MTETKPPAATATATATPRFQQAVSGVVPPQLGEGRVRQAFPTLVGISAGAASLGKRLMQSVVLLPLGWLLIAPVFLLKFAPFLCRRYTLTNRRLMIQRGWRPKLVHEVALADIDDVRLDQSKIDSFYLSGTLEIISKGQVVLTLPGVPEPEGFRQAILNTVKAWVPGRARGPWQAASDVK
jgi:hypothetical protein